MFIILFMTRCQQSLGMGSHKKKMIFLKLKGIKIELIKNITFNQLLQKQLVN